MLFLLQYQNLVRAGEKTKELPSTNHKPTRAETDPLEPVKLQTIQIAQGLNLSRSLLLVVIGKTGWSIRTQHARYSSLRIEDVQVACRPGVHRLGGVHDGLHGQPFQ